MRLSLAVIEIASASAVVAGVSMISAPFGFIAAGVFGLVAARKAAR